MHVLSCFEMVPILGLRALDRSQKSISMRRTACGGFYRSLMIDLCHESLSMTASIRGCGGGRLYSGGGMCQLLERVRI